MSSSTVLFAANQEVRRRQGAMGDDEPGIGLVDGDGESNGRINGGVVEDGIIINSRRKSRHGSRKRSRCPTLATLFTANLLCLLLAQMAMRFALRNENSFMVNFLGIPAFEGKMENEIKGLRRELRQKIEDEVVIFQNELRKLDGRTESMEKWLGEFRAKGLMNKEDFDEFYDELKKAKGDEVLSLDYVREYAKEIIEKEIEKHAADGLGKVDYALASGGAVVWWHSEPFNNGKSKNGVQNDAEKMLKPSFGEPGECFPLKGSSGFVQIRLRTAIIPEAITLEHVAKSVAYDRSSAPKDCRVTGWLQGKGTELRVDSEKILVLANFSYDLNNSNAQTFNVVGSARSTAVDMIRFDFTSNHGTASHTCIYRLRVHGHEPASV